MRHVSRADLDLLAVESHQRAAAAWETRAFNDEIVPVTVGRGDKAKTFYRDEGVRPESAVEAPGETRTLFRADGGVTAGNASQLSDGAAAVIVGSGKAAEQLGVKPMARVVAYATSGVAPKDIFLAPVSAVRQVLDKAKLAIKDIDLFELNEAFAAQMLACNRDLGIDPRRINVHGGAIALGHPIGAAARACLDDAALRNEKHTARARLGVVCAWAAATRWRWWWSGA